MSKLRDSARGQQCQVRLKGCSFDSETVVLAHLNGGGIGMKRPDNEGAFCCFACHQVLDGNRRSDPEIKLAHLEGVMRTQRIWIEMGLLVVK